jgi:hypothetical protein
MIERRDGDVLMIILKMIVSSSEAYKFCGGYSSNIPFV